MSHVKLWFAVFGLALSQGSAVAQPAKGRPAPAPRKPPPAKDIAPHVTALWGTDVEAAAKGALNLGLTDSAAAHEALLDALALGLAPSVATEAISALVLHPAPPDVLHLRRYANHRNPNVRSVAVASLAMYPDPKAHAAVVAALHDSASVVRAAGAMAAGRGKIKAAIPDLFALLARGEESAARGLAQIADPDLARKIADELGKVPDASLALCLGLVLKRSDFGPDTARVEVVRAIGKIQDKAAITALTEYIDATPKTPPRASRQEAEAIVGARGGK
ncbi:MAG: HEAT repeat domain-containing protein [Deltaproteobacteria bacterium]|nr:HEAT repeat domain-containing protein [Deltaproteobacteria bacterium]